MDRDRDDYTLFSGTCDETPSRALGNSVDCWVFYYQGFTQRGCPVTRLATTASRPQQVERDLRDSTYREAAESPDAGCGRVR